ncbi:oxidoreductase [Enterobacterales bacterium CwR94]|nr:oxidoreductase [Enterobacterales bacterium CwR94]
MSLTCFIGKKALVTGASRGIGKAIALQLAAQGADVVITYEKSTAKAAEVVAEIEKLGRKATAIQADSASSDAIKRAVQQAVETLGALDILVNNAGIAARGPLVSHTEAEIDALINVNIRGVVYATQAAIPHLRNGGRVISIGSRLGERVAIPGVTLYAMTKSALNGFTRGMARELGDRGITVNLVQPGSTDTDMNPADGEGAAGQLQLNALGHYGTVQDIAEAVAFLASPAAKQITGTTLTIDGGTNA